MQYNGNSSKIDSLRAVLFRVQHRILNIADYTNSSTESCARRRAISILQRKRGAVNSAPRRDSPAECRWAAAMMESAETPLPTMESCIKPSSVSPTLLIQIIRVTSQAFQAILSDLTGPAVDDRMSLVAAFNLLSAAIGPIIVPVLCISESGPRHNIFVRAVDEGMKFIILLLHILLMTMLLQTGFS